MIASRRVVGSERVLDGARSCARAQRKHTRCACENRLFAASGRSRRAHNCAMHIVTMMHTPTHAETPKYMSTFDLRSEVQGQVCARCTRPHAHPSCIRMSSACCTSLEWHLVRAPGVLPMPVCALVLTIHRRLCPARSSFRPCLCVLQRHLTIVLSTRRCTNHSTPDHLVVRPTRAIRVS
jgi:hypothetical protein